MDENFEFHKKLKNAVSAELINEEEFEKIAKNFAINLKSKVIKNEVENILEKRSKDFLNYFKEYNRGKQRDLVKLNSRDFCYSEYYNIKQKKSLELKELLGDLKQMNLSKEEKYFLESIPKNECSPFLLKILEKFKCSNIDELVEKIHLMDTEKFIDINNFHYNLGKSQKFRKRKIKELISYRNSQTASLSTDLEKFILNTHELVDKKTNYRNSS